MRKIEAGNKENNLTIVREVFDIESESRRFVVRCDCGTEKEISERSFGRSVSCRKCPSMTHGMRQTKQYGVWKTMKYRCRNKNSEKYKRYGERGIDICKKWETFIGFWEDMGEGYKRGLSIDRMDNDKGYYKENCRWATPMEQANNTSTNVFLEFDGKRMTIAQWGREVGINQDIIQQRIGYHGWSVQRALTQPPRKQKQLLTPSKR